MSITVIYHVMSLTVLYYVQYSNSRNNDQGVSYSPRQNKTNDKNKNIMIYLSDILPLNGYLFVHVCFIYQ